MNAWTCPGCEHQYLDASCPTCHMQGYSYTCPVPLAVNGVNYLVQRPLRGPVIVVRSDNSPMLVGERAKVLMDFLSQQHS